MSAKKWVLCVIVIIIWSFSSALVSIFSPGCNPLVLSWLVVTISLAIFSSIILIKAENREILHEIGLRQVYYLIPSAVLGIFLYPIVYFFSISGTSPAKANILNYLWPVIAYITSSIRESRDNVWKKKSLTSIICAALGAYFVMFINNRTLFSFGFEDLFYMFFSLLGAVFYGIYTAIIDLSAPKLEENSPYYYKLQDGKLPSTLRMFIMLAIAEILHIVSIVISAFFSIDSLKKHLLFC